MKTLEVYLAELLDINPNIDIGEIEKAYNMAEQMHEGQLRKSGEPYLIHPIEVSLILAGLGMDERTIVAGLLHDAVEDTPYRVEELKNDFGSEVALLVDGVTKLASIRYESKEERQAENLRKMFLAMSKDIRVLIIKLADRLHNLRTINYMSENQILDKCRESIEIYAPLASRLGMYNLKFELEDISLKYLEPDAYYELVAAVNEKKSERQAAIDQVIGELREKLDELHIEYDVSGRSKHFYSIYRKMKYQNKQIDEIFDLIAIRIIVSSSRECYEILGLVNSLYTPLPGRIKDYIAQPKQNLYQSLHTTVIGSKGQTFEIQIRTKEMHQVAEYGIAAHWKYKEGIDESQEEVKLAWLRQTLEWNQDYNDPREFMDALKMDLFSNQVFVFTPRGDVIELPAGSTPIDFAFKIHSDVGARCIGAKINGKMVSIDYELQNGEIVDIVTSNSSKGPSFDWLKVAKSSHARAKIRAWLKKQDRSTNVEKGKELIERTIKRKGYDPKQVVKNTTLLRIAKQQKMATVDELLTSASYGGAVLSKVVAGLIDTYESDIEEKKERDRDTIESHNKGSKSQPLAHKDEGNGVGITGTSGLLVRLARCCSPVPGDEIVGYITKGKGISVHRTDCTNIVNIPESEKGRLIDVQWEQEGALPSDYDADLYIKAVDRKGLFSDISRVALELDINITRVDSRTNADESVDMELTLKISNVNQIQAVMKRLKMVEGVNDVLRARI
ncbi:MAG: bifunctional (p)ppGpp synthetase/guanosine-3',5'-bis(diphosphate) 3'-pyrophosphohydrolase [Clostridiales Family XIII bacterium]|jgi:GTP pyrophosphokinase|nr:bifunctional (p)ppGpp synthetase/guanosine-3',5'-bis(diphosphate) 3'-pyrophosphohydrolase [Clostridiales Family XIII bacterium]